MKRLSQIFLPVVFAALFMAMNVFAQAENTEAKLNFKPESKIWVAGTSTLHDFTVNAKEIDATLKVDKSNLANQQLIIENMKVVVPVKKLDTDKSSMNDNMQDALKADDNPDIVYQLNNPVSVKLPAVSDSVQLKADGTLTIAGVRKPVTLTAELVRTKDGLLHFKGDQKILMTDYGVEPPTMFFGTIKTGNKVVIHYDVVINNPEL